jgi:hypothetical protein
VPQGTSWSDNACTADHYSGHATPSLGWIWLPCGCVSCDPGCTHWRIVINAWETWTVAAADGVGCACVRWEINFLLTFETAPFFCVYPVYNTFSQHRCTLHGRHRNMSRIAVLWKSVIYIKVHCWYLKLWFMIVGWLDCSHYKSESIYVNINVSKWHHAVYTHVYVLRWLWLYDYYQRYDLRTCLMWHVELCCTTELYRRVRKTPYFYNHKRHKRSLSETSEYTHQTTQTTRRPVPVTKCS